MDGRANKRVDRLLTLLLKFEEDMFFAWKQHEMLWSFNPLQNREINRHDNSHYLKKEDFVNIKV